MREALIGRAVILAAGRGTRMGEITKEIPKPMVPVQGKPLLEHILERLASSGVRKFFAVVGYRHELIEEHFRDSDLSIEFCVQDPVNGTGSAALLAKNFTGDEPFLLTYGDILVQPEEYRRCATVLDEHPECVSAVAVKRVDDPWQGAAVYETQGRIRQIIEKPPKGTSRTNWNSAGFYGFRPLIYRYLTNLEPSPRGEYELTSALDSMLADGLDLQISAVEGNWRDVGRPEDLKAVNEAS